MDWKQSTWLIGVLLALAGTEARAQTNVNSTTPVKLQGQVVSPDKLTVNDVSAAANLRPDRAERDTLPPEVKDRVQHFREAARAYLVQQELLKKQLQGANDKERAALREKLKQLRLQWLERAREMRKEFRVRQQELMDKLPDYREVIDSARDAARQQALQSQQDTRTRRGED